MPESAYIQQSIAAKRQAQQANNNNQKNAVDFATQMQNIIHARQLEQMRGSLGV